MQKTHRARGPLRSIWILAAGFLTITGCKAKDAADNSAPVAAPHEAKTASRTQADADAAAMASYPLTAENVAKTAKVMQTIRSLEKSDPALKAQWDSYAPKEDAKNIDEAIAQMAKAPHASEILGGAGISAHDFMYTTFALMSASMAYQMKKAGHPLPVGSFADHVNPANIDFVATHQAEIKAISDANAAASSDDNR